MSNSIYISRNFVEFGAFRPEEIIDFRQRGIIASSDFLRVENTEEWLSADQWAAPAVAEGPQKKPKAAKSTTTKKRSPAKKAA